jgi:REP element-mobilizing transposase RayT
MARVRKRHVQLGLMNPAGTRIWKDPGKRARVVARRASAEKRKPGRPKKPDAGASHQAREAFKPSEPVHVVLRVVDDVRGLRRRAIYHAIREATLVAARNAEAFRIVHVSIQQTHVHMLVEAEGRAALAKGMQGFLISAAKQINRALVDEHGKGRRGRVFSDRYFAEVIRVPRQARHVLAYVLNNWRKHREDRGKLSSTWLVDPFSTGALFSGWTQLAGRDVMWPIREGWLSMFVWLPRTWLLAEGWRRHGLIDGREVPSERRPAWPVAR